MILALHGFLGRAADWDVFRRDWSELGDGEMMTPSLFSPAVKSWAPTVGQSMVEWARVFGAEINQLRGNKKIILVGYSLGGRLALHLLLERPELFSHAVIVSAGTGIEGETERQVRREADEKWAQRFEREAWEDVVRDWNAQPVFSGTPKDMPAPARSEPHFNRSALSAALREWSPARQEPLLSRLPEIQCPLLWVAGEKDPAYVQQGERAVKLMNKALFFKIPGVGHRAPWESPKLFGQHVKDFLKA